MPSSRFQLTGWTQTLFLSALGGLSVPLMTFLLVRHATAQQILTSTVMSLSYALVIGSLVHLVIQFAGQMMYRPGPVPGWLLGTANLVVCAVVGCFLGTGIGIAILRFPWSRFWPIYRDAIRVCIPISLAVGTLIAFLDRVRSQMRATELELRTKELERERAEKLAAEARLSSLESRIHPHFLFNSLNSISALIREDPAGAEQLLGKLSTLLRFSLDSHASKLVPLAREIKIVSDYLEIERVRFGSRLRFEIDVPEGLAQAVQVPPLSVQTLVENSVKYAIAPRREGGFVQVAASRNGNGEVRIEIRDDGPGFSPEVVQRGHGVDLLQSRLEALFGKDHARLEIQGSMVAIRLKADARLPA